MSAGQSTGRSETVTLQYRCKLCGSLFLETKKAGPLPGDTLRLMQHFGLARHNCLDKRVGIAELEGYTLDD